MTVICADHHLAIIQDDKWFAEKEVPVMSAYLSFLIKNLFKIKDFSTVCQTCFFELRRGMNYIELH